MQHWRRFLAEALGTFGLVLVGTGAIALADTDASLMNHTGISIAFGAIVTAMILALGRASGAHINPAVSIAFNAWGSLPRAQTVGYVLAQLVGGIAASVVVGLCFPASELLGSTMPADAWWMAFLLELLLTFLLMLGILWVAVVKRAKLLTVALVVGAIVGLEAYVAGPLTGASMNPARSIAPAFISGHLEHLWIYIVAPLLGALLAVPVTAMLWPASRLKKHD